MKKVLVFTDKISLSGASKIITWISNNLAKSDYEITLVTHLEYDDQRSIDNRIRRINLRISKGNRIIRGIAIIKELSILIKENNFDLCLGFLPTECLYLQIAAYRTRTKVIVCERSDPFLERSVIATVGRFFFNFADGAVFQTEGAKKYFSKRIQRKSIIIPNPAFDNNYEYIQYDKRDDTIAFSGRLFIKQKRQDLLIKAFSIVCETDSSVMLKIYGDGPDKEKLVELTKELKIDHRVVFLGNISNVEDEIRKCKLLVISSDYEGIPNVVIEALQNGVPVVATDCSPGGAALLIENGKNGVIVPRGDVKSLAEGISWVLNNPISAMTMSENALKITEEFNERLIIERWKEYLDRYI